MINADKKVISKKIKERVRLSNMGEDSWILKPKE